MQLRLKFVLLAVVPLLLAIAAVAAVVKLQGRALADAEHAIVEPALTEARRAELRNYVLLALASISHLSGRQDEAARRQALDLLGRLEFGDDGYFFVYDYRGRVLMHPRQPELVGRTLWDMKDPLGRPTIQNLIATARDGGGYVDFIWRRPSSGRPENKLGYVASLPGWEWMLGTGLYTDDIVAARQRMEQQAQLAIRNTLGVIAAIAVVATVLVALGGMALNLSDRRVAEQKMRELARQVVRSQETERTRVAGELHDGVSQSLVSVKFLLESAQARLEAPDTEAVEAARRSLGRGIAAMEDVLGDVRRISHGLRPTLLDTLGLQAAMKQVLDEFSARTGIACSMQTDADEQRGAGGDVATALFRLLQEALNNVERHATASRVTLSLRRDGAHRVLELADDGHGFDVDAVAASPRRGLGLSSMRERIEALGGSFRIESGPRGTTLTARLPEQDA
ncbi:cache domain-containing protein [Methyloversatilis thermotolerans]|uniref:cache domain-containing protein n=1 Tax=Methyloversatilis thermotolerans TaxID=1346290 RepID=UPI00036BD68D|nr:cache domain-containing protein [Methyloversatilis thermotolerans]